MTTRQEIACIFTGIALLLLASIAQAGGVVGNGTAASCTPAAFTQALAGGGSVTFACGPNPVTIVVPQRQTIAADTTVAGADRITLSGGGAHGLFTVQSGRTLTLDHVTIADGGVENWALYVSNGATLKMLGGGVDSCVRGGIYNAGGSVTVKDAVFVDNDASSAGAAITNEGGGTLSVERTVFEGNLNGAIFSAGPTTVTDSEFTDNHGDSAGGGAIVHSKSVAVTRCRFDGNDATSGGAIYTSGDLTVTDSVFDGNHATLFEGGAIQLYNQTQTPSSVTVRGSTFTANGAVRSGGAVRCDAPAGACTLENVTFSRNTVTQTGGAAEVSVKSGAVQMTHATVLAGGTPAIDRVAGAMTIRNSIVDGGACAGVVTNGGGNVQGTTGLCAGFATGALALSALGANGGVTPTHAIASGSAAVHAAINCLATDQRGVARTPAVCDAGAFQRGALPILTAIEPNHAQVGGATFTLTVKGASFFAAATRVLWNGAPLVTTFVSSTELTATVPAALIATMGVATVKVENTNPPLSDGGVSAESLPFTIDDTPPPGPCDGLAPYDAALCALAQAQLPGHFCAAGTLDYKKLEKPMVKALLNAAKKVLKARDVLPAKALKKRPKLLLTAKTKLDKLALKAAGNRTGTTTAECKLTIIDGMTALGADIMALPL